MGYSKTIVCLANSRKLSGRCIAGREVADDRFGAWVRPVSTRATREVSEEERWYENGDDPKLLDLVKIQLLQHEPEQHQQENHVFDDGYYWEKTGRVSWQFVQDAVEFPDQLWENLSESNSGKNDQVDVDRAELISASRYLIKPENLSILLVSTRSSKRQVRAQFQFQSTNYNLAVTDPVIECYCRAKGTEVTPVHDALLCLSLSEPLNGFFYKLVAGVITSKRAGV